MSELPRQTFQGSLFEEDYLLRTLGTLGYSPDVALTELVANAWDAGAGRVDIGIPERLGEELTVTDDGTGMLPEQVRTRWMTLGYNRARHQGGRAEFPPERANLRRPAYGRNGIGRHGLLCFSSRYQVETWKEGIGTRLKIATSSGDNPFVLQAEESFTRAGHGTRLAVLVEAHLPESDRIRQVLAARFLHDPQFNLYVNGVSVPLTEHTGLIDKTQLKIGDDRFADAYFIDSTKAARTAQYQGVAFWIGSRLVGEPSWIVGKESMIDGRTRIAKRYTVVISSQDFFDEVLPDYTAFRETPLTAALFAAVVEHVAGMLRRVTGERIDETKRQILSDHQAAIEHLRPSARLEVAEFLGEIAMRQPSMAIESMSVAVEAVINLERSRSGEALLEKLAKLSEEDVEALDRLLSEWSVKDALTVLDEIDRRLVVLEAIKKLSAEGTTDELHTLHPLVTQARWLFGPEYDSAEYASNVSLVNAAKLVFGKRLDPESFINHRRRPDLLVLADATVSLVATETYDDSKGLVALRNVLVIELKKGGAMIGREEANQASNYVDDLLHCGHLDGPPFVRAFVVGHRVNDKVEVSRSLGENPIKGRVDITTYAQLVRTGERRLFALRDRLTNRYEEISGSELLRKTAQVVPSERELPYA